MVHKLEHVLFYCKYYVGFTQLFDIKIFFYYLFVFFKKGGCKNVSLKEGKKRPVKNRWHVSAPKVLYRQSGFYPCRGDPVALSPASSRISASVGWAWMVWARSCAVNPLLTARVPSAMRSVA